MKRIFLSLLALAAFAAAVPAQAQQNPAPGVVQTIGVNIGTCGTPAAVQSAADAKFATAITTVTPFAAPSTPSGLLTAAATLQAMQQTMDTTLTQYAAVNTPFVCVRYRWVVSVNSDNTATIVAKTTSSGQSGIYLLHPNDQ